MATTVAKDVHDYASQRIVLSSPKPFEEVIVAIDKAMNREKAENVVWPLLDHVKSREEFVQGLDDVLDFGERDFVFLTALRHSNWLSLYHERKLPESVIYTFGNPLAAKDYLPKDPTLGLGAPGRAIVQEIEGGGTRIMYDSAALWFREDRSDEVTAWLEGLAAKAEAFFSQVLS